MYRDDTLMVTNYKNFQAVGKYPVRNSVFTDINPEDNTNSKALRPLQGLLTHYPLRNVLLIAYYITVLLCNFFSFYSVLSAIFCQ